MMSTNDRIALSANGLSGLDAMKGFPIEQIRQGHQSNHGSWLLADAVSHLRPQTLWLAVACWGMHYSRTFTRDDIAQAFHINPRRAADVMTYILDVYFERGHPRARAVADVLSAAGFPDFGKQLTLLVIQSVLTD